MRLKTLTVAGFRGFANYQSFDLDADAVIVVGANGSGKTSMFDAVLWALTGSIQRLSDEAKDVVSKYSTTGEARVELEIERNDATMRIIRRFDGSDNLTVEDDEVGSVSGIAAETALIELLWPDARSAVDPNQALTRSLTRAMYLQQDVVGEFVNSDDEQMRFNVVSELVGAGRVTELQRALENSRKTWSEATNTLRKELDPIRSQIAALEDRVRRLSSSDDITFDHQDFDRWVDDLTTLVSSGELSDLRRRSSDAVDRVLSVLQALQRQDERRVSGLQQLLNHLATPRPEVIDVAPLQTQVHATESLVAEASSQLRLAQEFVAGERRRQAELRDTVESLRTLAQLALRHLGDRCPVCDQNYDVAATRLRLEELVGRTADLAELAASDPVPGAATQVEELQRSLANDQAQLRAAQSSQSAAAQWDQIAASLAEEHGLAAAADLAEVARSQWAELRERQTKVQNLRIVGERFSLQLVRVAELAQRSELSSQLTHVHEDLARREGEVEARVETHKLASDLIAALRGASNAIVTEELSRIDPLLQRIYASVDPHPSFRAVQFLTRERRGHGRVWTALTDQPEGKTVEDPSLVLSSSQLNVLAVSTFLALNLAIETLPLQVVALDDPLQSLDTVNLLGLADLLRRVRATRQVIVSTHDERLAQLLSRKLRATNGGRTRLVRLDAWSRSGPIVDQNDVPADVAPLKLVMSA
jgi:DNA repair exonuclease SbcCD ATPase subunit